MWESTKSDWEQFLQEVRNARTSVGTTYTGAWFRGQAHNWDLLPSILRDKSFLESQIESKKRELKKDEKALVKAEKYALERNIPEDEVIRQIKKRIGDNKKILAHLEEKIPTKEHIPGEGRAFVEFRFRGACQHQSSWQTLAEMQHYGVPTRLLDWTESFIYALAFALEDYIKALDEKWTNDRYSVDSFNTLRFHDLTILRNDVDNPEPTLWILNPYKMDFIAKGKNVLWDPTINPIDDYFNTFIDERNPSKPFENPIPILSPWKDDRIAAQQGVFTCYGTNFDPLDTIYNSRVIQKIKISKNAAIHGVRFLYEIGGLDIYTMFRDKDSLGKKTKKEFLSLNIKHNK